MNRVPRSGPIPVDCRSLGVNLTLQRVRRTVRCIRRGARKLVVRLDEAETITAIETWAAGHGARYQRRATDRGWEIDVYLLPNDFGEAPEVSWRELSIPLDAISSAAAA